MVLILKGKELLAQDALLYRTICLMSGLGKLYENFRNSRLENEMQAKGGLSPRKFGRSTVHAIEEALSSNTHLSSTSLLFTGGWVGQRGGYCSTIRLR